MAKSKEAKHRYNHRRLRCHRRNRLVSFCIERAAGHFLLAFFLFAVTGWARSLWSVSTTKVNASTSYPMSRWRTKQGLSQEDNDNYSDESATTRRRLLLIGRMCVDSKVPGNQFKTSRRNHNREIDDIALVSDNQSRHALYSEEDCRISEVRNVSRKIPTPWPLNVIQERWNSKRESLIQTQTEDESIGGLNDGGTSRMSSYPSMGALFFAYAKQQARIGFRQVSEISSQIWYNLPPSAPPLILLASIPRNVKLLEGKNAVAAASGETFRRIIPVFSDPFARSLVLAGLGMAVVSWSNQELQRKRKLAPLALTALSDEQGVKGCGRVSRVFLPPFLPEVVPEPEIDALLGTNVDESDVDGAESDELAANVFEEKILSNVSPKIRKHLDGIYETTTTTSRRFFRNYYKDWLQGRAARKREVAKIRRNRIYDELVALQALKKRQRTSRFKSGTKTNASLESQTPDLGYALVTGASRGIGRAIAVELARWEIPLVLVARDVAKLAQLASDLEACYGVKCCILEADLSKANAAEKIHQATTEAGIPVDILINNAGAASEGLAVDSETSAVERMIMLNSLTYAKLGVLYGRDMKEKRRGRILMMSSMAGLCNAAPNTAIYGACKAFGKSLALSMAKEMETYGVGVTCLTPGPVSDTDFRTNSGTRKALCWYLPFYTRSPDIIAHQGVISLLDGDTQSIPGWQNRAFANIVRPIIPQRLEVMIVQLAFSPLQMPSLRKLLRLDKENTESDKVEIPATGASAGNSISADGGSSWLSLKPRYTTQPPPRFLKLPEDEPEEVETQLTESDDESLSTDEPTSSSPDAADNTNSSEDGTSAGDIEGDQKDTPQFDSAISTPNSNEETENAGQIYETEPSTSQRPSGSSEIQHTYSPDDKIHSEERSVEKKVIGAKVKSVESGKTRSPPKTKRNDYNRDRSRTHSKHNSEKISGERRVERVRTPQWFGYDEDDDDAFSTTLGPITRKDQRSMMLPKQINANRRETMIFNV